MFKRIIGIVAILAMVVFLGPRIQAEDAVPVVISCTSVLQTGCTINLSPLAIHVTVPVLTNIGDDLPPTMMRVYPGSTQRKLLDVSKLPDGTYHRRLILDNGSDWLVPVEIDFVKGRSQDDLALAYLHGERQQRIGDLSIGLDWGNLRKGIRLLGNLNLGRFSFSASGARNQFQDIFQNGYQVYGSFRTNHFSLSAGQFWYARNRTFRSVNGTIYFGRFSGSVNYSPDFKMTSIYSSINLSSRLSFSGYMTFGPGQKDWLGTVYYRIF